jgi:hypothetical protein
VSGHSGIVSTDSGGVSTPSGDLWKR